MSRPVFKSLSEFSDEEISREYHWRAMRKLGDPRICVSWPQSDFRPWSQIYPDTVGSK